MPPVALLIWYWYPPILASSTDLQYYRYSTGICFQIRLPVYLFQYG